MRNGGCMFNKNIFIPISLLMFTALFGQEEAIYDPLAPKPESMTIESPVVVPDSNTFDNAITPQPVALPPIDG